MLSDVLIVEFVAILILWLVYSKYVKGKKEWGIAKEIFFFVILPPLICKVVFQLFIWLFEGLNGGEFLCGNLVESYSCGFWEWLVNIPFLIFIVLPNLILGLIAWAIAIRIRRRELPR